jgi:hypothetical protein
MSQVKKNHQGYGRRIEANPYLIIMHIYIQQQRNKQLGHGQPRSRGWMITVIKPAMKISWDLHYYKNEL